MKKTLLINLASLGLCGIMFSCNSTKMHHAKFYNKLGEGAEQEGYHHNEAQRVLDLNERNEEANQKKADVINEEISANLNRLNKPNLYNSAPQKAKKKRFTFYL